MSNITKFYLIQIELGRITIDQVPKKYRTDVEKAMEESSKWWLFFNTRKEKDYEDSYQNCKEN